MRRSLTDKSVAALKPRVAALRPIPTPSCAAITSASRPSGAKSFVAVTRDPDGKQVWATLGGVDLMSVEEAQGAGARGHQARPGGPASLLDAGQDGELRRRRAEWLKRYVAAKGLRSVNTRSPACSNRHVLPGLAGTASHP